MTKIKRLSKNTLSVNGIVIWIQGTNFDIADCPPGTIADVKSFLKKEDQG